MHPPRIVDRPRRPRFKAFASSDTQESVEIWTKLGIDTVELNDQGVFDAANNHFLVPMDRSYLFGAMLLYKVGASTTARMRGRFVLNGTTEIRGSSGEFSGEHVSEAKAPRVQTMMMLIAGDTVELQRDFRVADGHFAAEQTLFWEAKAG